MCALNYICTNGFVEIAKLFIKKKTYDINGMFCIYLTYTATIAYSTVTVYQYLCQCMIHW